MDGVMVVLLIFVETWFRLHSMNKTRLVLVLLVIVVGTTNCDENITERKEHLNDFRMTVNNEVWIPNVIDPCTRAFKCTMASLGGLNYYTIHAYRDSKGTIGLTSENFFQFQVMKVNSLGVYRLDEKFRDFDSYARLTINEDGERRVYQNKENCESFVVSITELYPKEHSNLVGVKGLFSGYLYNLSNPNDSIKVEQGEFFFKRINFNDFNQCGNY
jgi:hypothetical protein